MLKLRVLTAVILIPLVILGIFHLSNLFFFLATLIIFCMAAWEWARLSGWSSLWLKLFYVLLMIAGMMVINLIPAGNIITIAIGAFWWSLVALWILKARRQVTLVALPQWSILLSGFLVLLPCWHAILLLRRVDPALLLYMLLMIWICDSAAYFGGRLWGKRKLAVNISPNKTFEGLYAGFVVTILASFAAAWFVFTPYVIQLSWLLPVIPLIAAVVIGDLFESALKRMQNLKDSGHLLPGHGGLLDRIDSLTAAAPVFTCVMIFLRQAGY